MLANLDVADLAGIITVEGPRGADTTVRFSFTPFAASVVAGSG
jgi:hypothetical protein